MNFFGAVKEKEVRIVAQFGSHAVKKDHAYNRIFSNLQSIVLMIIN
jgi:hypothetical protein